MTWLAIVTNRWIQLAAGIFGAFVIGFGMGHHAKTLEDAAAALRGAQKAVQTVAKGAAATSVIDQHTASVTAAIQQHTVTLIQKVPVYVTRKADDQCIVSNGAKLLLDAAALNTVPAAAVSLPDADSGVGLSDIVQADILNAGSYRQAVTKGSGWDDWYDAMNPSWKKDHPPPGP